MNEIRDMAIAFTLGALLGVIFFGGLWLTVKKGLESKTPALWFSASLVIRLGLVLGGFYFIVTGFFSDSGENPGTKLLLALAGLLVARVILTKAWRKQAKSLK